MWTKTFARHVDTFGNTTHLISVRYFRYIADTVLIGKSKRNDRIQRLVRIIYRLNQWRRPLLQRSI